MLWFFLGASVALALTGAATYVRWGAAPRRAMTRRKRLRLASALTLAAILAMVLAALQQAERS